MEEFTLEQYEDVFIAANNCIPLNQKIGDKQLYLKDYSKLITVVEENLFHIPKKFSEKKIDIIEEPSREEKLILAGSMNPWEHLLAIVEGRKLLNSKSKEEAIEFCQEELTKLTKEFASLNTNSAQISLKEKLITLTLGYLEGNLYQEMKKYLALCFEKKVKDVSKDEWIAVESKSNPSDEVVIADSIEEKQSESKIEESSSTELQDNRESITEPTTTLNNDAYQRMVEEVVGNDQKENLDLDAAVSLLNAEAVPVNPESISTPSEVSTQMAPQTIIPVADTLAQMMDTSNTTAYASSVDTPNYGS